MIFVQPGQNLAQILASAPPGERIVLPEGTFRAKCVVSAPGLTVEGAGPDKTAVVWDS